MYILSQTLVIPSNNNIIFSITVAGCNMDCTHFSSKKQESTTNTSKPFRRILSSPTKTNINSQRLLQKLSKNQEPQHHELQDHQDLLLKSSLSSLKVQDGEKDASRNDSGGRERLKRHREEVAGQVIIPENWSQENFLKDWIDYSSFDNLLAPNGIASAREALMADARRRRPSSQRLRMESRC